MKTGRGSPHYGTKRRVRKDGYVDIFEPTHPAARRDGYVFEHRKVAYDAGLPVASGFDVHHVNGDRGDNRLENLEVISTAEHTRRHHGGRTHCSKGHEYTPENTWRCKKTGWRQCRTCNHERYLRRTGRLGLI